MEQWCEACRRVQAALGSSPEKYLDIHHDCWRCGASAVFTAEDQKHTFEVRKANVWQRRVLCTPCWRERLAIEAEARACGERWADRSKRHSAEQDGLFLRRWLELLESVPKYGGKRDEATIRMLSRRLQVQP